MGLTYFKRFRMDCDLRQSLPSPRPLPPGYELVPFRLDLVREHAIAKFESFREEMDANVFPCLGRRDGCLRLMREIVSRATFVPEATWLLRHRGESGKTESVGTVQGLQNEGWGAIQNLGIQSAHRGRGLGSILMMKAAAGFWNVGIQRIHLEVTTENTAAVRLYERLGFKRSQVVYKAAEVAGV
ncbi:MAG: GNAT family N-acetyltransferase [Pirellulaceae bacterium]